MYTLRFQVPRLRPDFARFETDAEAARAAHNLFRIHAGRSCRAVLSHKGLTVWVRETKQTHDVPGT